MKRIALFSFLLPTLLFANSKPSYEMGATVVRSVQIKTEITQHGEEKGEVLFAVDATVRYVGDRRFAVQIHRILAEGDCESYGPHMTLRGKFDTAVEGEKPTDQVYMRSLQEALEEPIFYQLDEYNDPELCDGCEVSERFAAWPIVRGLVATIIPELLFDGEYEFMSSDVVREGDLLVMRGDDGEETTWVFNNPLICHHQEIHREELTGEGITLVMSLTLSSNACCMDAVVEGDAAEADAQQFEAGMFI